MEANSGGGLLSGVGMSHANGGGAPNVNHLVHHGWQTQQPFFNEFSSQQPPENNILFPGGGHGQTFNHQQLMQQQQQQMLQMAAAGSNHGQQGAGQQGPHMGALPSMNMLLQGMQTQGIHQTLQSQPNSAQPGFLLLPNLGLPHQGQHTRDLSPNSTPSLSGHPPTSNTPPELNERSWASQSAQHNILFGHRLMNHHPDKMDELPNHMALAAAMSAAAGGQGGMGELLFSETFHGINQLGRQQQQDQSMPLNQIHLSDLAMSRGMNLYQHHYVSANSPPQIFNQQIPPQQMPPRPRPEGGQDPPSFSSEHEGKHRPSNKDDLIIGSWSEDDMEKLEAQQQPQHMFGTGHLLTHQHQQSSEEKELTGWGALPPPNASNASGWGTVAQTPVMLQNQGVAPLKTNWNPIPFESQHIVSKDLQRSQRGGTKLSGGDYRPRYNVAEQFDVVNGITPGGNAASSVRNNPRGSRVFSSSRGRGGHHPRGDLSREKEDGKKSALAETIAMMSKMKMEEKERKEPVRFDKRRGGSNEMALSQGRCHLGERRSGYCDRDPMACFYEVKMQGRGALKGAPKYPRGGINSINNCGPQHSTLLSGGKPSAINHSSTDGIPPFPGIGKMSLSQNTMSFPGSYPTQAPNPFIPVSPGFRFPRGPNVRGLPLGLNGPRGPLIPQLFANQSRQLLLARPPFLHQRPPVRNMSRSARGSSVSSMHGNRHNMIGAGGFPVGRNEKNSFQNVNDKGKEGSSQDESLPPPIASSKNSPSPLEDEDVGDPCKSKSNVECLTEETQKDLNSGQETKRAIRLVCKHHCNIVVMDLAQQLNAQGPCQNNLCMRQPLKNYRMLPPSTKNQFSPDINHNFKTVSSSTRFRGYFSSRYNVGNLALQMKNGENYSVALERDSSCALIEQNRRLAEALQIQTPDLTDNKGPPKYPDTLKEFAKKVRSFAQYIHYKLKELI